MVSSCANCGSCKEVYVTPEKEFDEVRDTVSGYVCDVALDGKETDRVMWLGYKEDLPYGLCELHNRKQEDNTGEK